MTPFSLGLLRNSRKSISAPETFFEKKKRTLKLGPSQVLFETCFEKSETNDTIIGQ